MPLHINLNLTTIWPDYNLTKNSKNLTYIIKLKSLDYTKPTFNIINNISISLLKSIIKKKHL